MVSWLHLCRAAESQDPLPSTKSTATGTREHLLLKDRKMSKLTHADAIFLQLDLIVELLGRPNPEDLRYAVESAKTHVMKYARRLESQSPSARNRLSLFHVINQTDPATIDLLGRMLKFDPVSPRVDITTTTH